MRLLRVLFGIFLVASFGWTVPQSEETIGNLKFNLPPGWTKRPYRNEIELKPGDVHPSESCTVTIKSGLQANGDLTQWVNKQADEFLRGRQVLMNTPIPYQDDPKGWEGCGLSFAVRVNANTPTYYHMFIGFRRGGVAGTMHFVTDKLEYTQKYQQPIGLISGSLKPTNGFGGTPTTIPPGNAGATPPITNPTGSLANPTNPSTPIDPGAIGDLGSTPVNSPDVYMPDALPPPASVPEGPANASASSLAKRILKGGQDGLAALERAVLMSGYSIHELPGKTSIAVAQTPNGMSFADIDLVGANALAECGGSLDLGSLQDSFRGVRGFEQVDFITLWKSSIAGASSSSKPTEKFFGALMKALGTESQGRFADLSAPTAASKICPAQLFLLVWRSMGHILAAKREEPDVPRGPYVEPQDAGMDAVRNLAEAVSSFTNVDWVATITPLISQRNALDLNIYFLAIARLQIALAGLEWRSGFPKDKPLVRSKNFQESGENRLLHVVARFTLKNRGAWDKYVAAIHALGYKYPGMNQIGSIRARYAGPGNATIRPNAQQSIQEQPGPDGFKIFLIPIQGSPQKRKLSSNPAPQHKTALADLELRIVPNTSTDLVIGTATNEAIAAVGSKGIPLMVSRQFVQEVPVRDWKSAGWHGSLTTTIAGSGNWSKGASSVTWTIARDYELSGDFDKNAQGARVSRRTPAPVGSYTEFPGEPIQGKAVIDDKCVFKGPIRNCMGETIGHGTITTTWKSASPKDRIEVVGLQQKPALEFETSSNSYSIEFMNGQPFVPVVKKTTYVLTKGKPRPPTIEHVRMGLLSGLSIAEEDSRRGRYVLDQKIVEDERLHDSFSADYPFVGSEPHMSGKARMTLGWDLTTKDEEPSLKHLASWGLRFLALNELLHSIQVRETVIDVEPTFNDLEDMATCAETKAAIQGKLQHANDRSRQARYRSNR